MDDQAERLAELDQAEQEARAEREQFLAKLEVDLEEARRSVLVRLEEANPPYAEGE